MLLCSGIPPHSVLEDHMQQESNSGQLLCKVPTVLPL